MIGLVERGRTDFVGEMGFVGDGIGRVRVLLDFGERTVDGTGLRTGEAAREVAAPGVLPRGIGTISVFNATAAF